jgi:hypothetical protein
MRTETIQIYKFEELSKESKEKAMEQVRKNLYLDYIWDDAHESVKEFHNLFGTKTGYKSWLDIQTGHIDDNILELSGNRLRTYILNNYGYGLFTRKYLKHGKLRREAPKHHRMRKATEIKGGSNKGLFSVSYYSNIQKTADCVLTGVCYDNSILWPIYEFLKKPDSRTFEELLKDCIEEIEKDIKSEIEYRQSEEGVKEEIESRGDFEFEENGEIY